MSPEDPGNIPSTLPKKDASHPVGSTNASVLAEANTTSVLAEANTTSVLAEANTTSIEAMILQNQRRWTGHCVRMPDSRLPRQVLFSQLTHGLRTRGGQRKGFKDNAKDHPKKGHININTWEDMTADRLLWRRSVHQASAPFETDRLLHEAEKRHRRKEREMSQRLHIVLPPGTCPHCNEICKSRFWLLSYLRIHDQPLADVVLVSSDR